MQRVTGARSHGCPRSNQGSLEFLLEDYVAAAEEADEDGFERVASVDDSPAIVEPRLDVERDGCRRIFHQQSRSRFEVELAEKVSALPQDQRGSESDRDTTVGTRSERCLAG